MRKLMIILLYFDWAGTKAELKEYCEKIVSACENTEVQLMGLYGPMNVKWNYVGMFETDSYDRFLKMGRQVTRHPKMPHHITEILIKQDI